MWLVGTPHIVRAGSLCSNNCSYRELGDSFLILILSSVFVIVYIFNRLYYWLGRALLNRRSVAGIARFRSLSPRSGHPFSRSPVLFIVFLLQLRWLD